MASRDIGPRSRASPLPFLFLALSYPQPAGSIACMYFSNVLGACASRPALDYVSVDTYLPGGAEPPYARAFYTDFIYPKMSANQGVWVIPGLMATIEAADSFEESLAKSVNDTLFIEKMEAYLEWTEEDPRLQGW